MIPMCFFGGILRIFGEKSQNRKNWKSRHIGLLCRGVDLRQGVGCLASARPRCQNVTPQVCHDVEKLHRNEGLRRVAMPCRGVTTIHKGKNFRLCSESLVFVHR